MIFWIGFTLMFFNEGFVMMRHVSPLAAQIREELIKDLGDTWQKIHSTLDCVVDPLCCVRINIHTT